MPVSPVAVKPKPLPAEHRLVLDWLCKQPADVFDFADIAKSLEMKPGKVEKIVVELHHQKWGAPLVYTGPDGLKLKPRHAYLPANSPARNGYAKVPTPKAGKAEHPTLTALKKAQAEKQAEADRRDAEHRAKLKERGDAAASYKKAKNEAREKARLEKEATQSPKKRYVTGYADPIGPQPAATKLEAPVTEKAGPSPAALSSEPTATKTPSKKASE